MKTITLLGIDLAKDVFQLHRVNEYGVSLVQDRTALANRTREYLQKMGIFLVAGLSQVRKEVPFLLEDATNDLTVDMSDIISHCHKKVLELDEEIERDRQKIEQFCKQNRMCGRLMQLPGADPMSASIIYAAVGDPLHFKNGRHFAAYLGLIPSEHLSGGKQCLMSISYTQDEYQGNAPLHYR